MSEINIKGEYQPKTKVKHEYKLWVCKCGHEVMAYDQPAPIRWTDGHTCHFYISKEEKI